MTKSASNTMSLEQQFAAMQPHGDVPDWLQQLRSHAVQQFDKNGLPSVRDEQWRYTNLRTLKQQSFVSAPSEHNIDVDLPTSDYPRMVLVNGHFDAELSTLGELGKGIQLTSLNTLLGEDADLLKPYFGAGLPTEQHGFTHLNTANCTDGFVLILANNVVCETTLEICFVNSQIDGAHSSHNRNLIIARANSQCSIIERHVGNDNSVYLNNNITEIHAGENAHIDHYRLLQESSEAFHIGGVFIHQATGSQVKNHNFSLSGLVCRNDIASDLLGQGAHIEMNGLVLGNSREHFDNHTEVNHAVPNCTSDEYYKTILDEQSRSVFRGRIIVAQDAQQTSAEQQNNNLLLSDRAEADSLPQLEIYADDVKCSHGATVGQLDPKSIFYLQSRGIDKATARSLLTFAFANEVIERIQIDSVREELTELLAGQLLSEMDLPQ